MEVIEKENTSEGQHPASMSIVKSESESIEPMVMENRDQSIMIDHDTCRCNF